MTQRRLGYIRENHSYCHQKQHLENANVEKLFIDSENDLQRKQLGALFATIQQGDTAVVDSMGGLACSLDDLCKIIRVLEQKGAHVELIQEQLNLDHANLRAVNFILSVIATVTQFTNALTRQRQRQGIDATQRRKVYKGRKKALQSTQVHKLRQQIQEGKSKAQAAREWGICRQTLYQYLETDD